MLSQLEKHDKVVQVALFKHVLADDALKAYNSFVFTTEESERTVNEITEKFEEYAIGKVNETYERFVFNCRNQVEGETFEQFYSNLRSLVKTCMYCDKCLPSMVRDRIVLGIRDSCLQTELLKVRDLTLEKCIDICKAAENATAQNRILRPDTVNKVTHENRGYREKNDKGKVNYEKPKKDCWFCGLKHVFVKEKCPAFGKKCAACGLNNHFAQMCRSQKSQCSQNKEAKTKRGHKIHNVCEMSDSDSSTEAATGTDFIHSVSSKPSSHDTIHKEAKCKMMIGGKEVIFQIDTGSTVNTLPLSFAKHVKPTNRVLKTWNHSSQVPVGMCTRNVCNPVTGQKWPIDFIVFKENLTPLLGINASQQMGLVEVKEDNFERVYNIKLEDEYLDVMKGSLGTLPGVQSLKVDPSIKPVIMPNRRMPISLKPKLKVELERLSKLGVIMPVDEPTPWVNQVVVSPKKDGKVRVCIDPRELNKALQREHFTLPILEDTLHELGQSRVFSKADLASGYWHVRIDTPSSYLTTFQTCYGRFRWLRLPFGLNVSSEIFQKRLLEALTGLKGVVCIADDVIIHGADTQEHDTNLESFLKRCRENNIQLNKDKIELRSDKLTFMGHQITKEGLQPDPEKVKVINSFPTPQSKTSLRSFLGMVNYVSRFLPNVCDVLHPLYNLLKNDVPWGWSSAQEVAFQKVKGMIADKSLLVFYDPNKELTLENDASEYGLGSVIMQEGKPVAFASRSLSESEKNYAQIEKEMLAVVYGLEKFHHYTYGRFVNVVTDHKPLVYIREKPLFRAPKRLQAMLMRTQEYHYKLSHKSGKDIPMADALSRAPVDEPREIMLPIHTLTDTHFKPGRLCEVKEATEKDEVLSQLKLVVLRGWPDNKSDVHVSVSPYFSYRDEINVQDGVLLRGERVIIPSILRGEIKRKLHAGHSGINSCLRRARELIFWPGMSSEIRQYIESCNVCASSASRQAPEPLYMHDIPDRPWQKVGTDIFTIKRRDYLVTVDYFSQFIEVDYLPVSDSETIVYKLKSHFARHGIPTTLISDNGPQFTAEHFQQFTRGWNISHETSSPGNSKANGAAEAAVKVVKGMMKRCLTAKEDMYLGLLNIRNTPQEGLNTSPAQRLMGRRMKTLVPTNDTLLKPRHCFLEEERKLMQNKKSTVAERHQDRRSLRPLSIGEAVRMQPIDNKMKEWKGATVIKKLKNRTYEVETEVGKKYRRNRQFIRATRVRREEDGNPNTGNGLQRDLEPVSREELEEKPAGSNDGITPREECTQVEEKYRTRTGREVTAPKRLDL